MCYKNSYKKIQKISVVFFGIFFATGLVFERFLASRSRFFRKSNDLEFSSSWESGEKEFFGEKGCSPPMSDSCSDTLRTPAAPSFTQPCSPDENLTGTFLPPVAGSTKEKRWKAAMEKRDGEERCALGFKLLKYFRENFGCYIAEAWCRHSGDARYGNDQNAKQFWKHVTKRFNKILGKGRNYRSFDQCNSKWNKMNREVQKFNGAYVNYRNQPHSGENDTNILARAEATYQQDTLNKWQFGHVWRVVKDNEKWNQLPLTDDIAKRGKRRNKLSTSHLPNSQDDPYNVDLDDDLPPPPPRNLPMGRDRAKKKAKTSSSESARSSSARSDELNQIRNQFENMTAQLSSRNELRPIQIYMRDISHLEGEELEKAKTFNAHLKQKWGQAWAQIQAHEPKLALISAQQPKRLLQTRELYKQFINNKSKLGSFENSYIPENPKTPKPLTFSKNRLRVAKNRSNTSPVAKKISEKETVFFKNFAFVQKNFFCIYAHFFVLFQKRLNT
ncbi:hypothetical protein LXL04_019886 [Taraxacum kok-saghyz]